VSLIYVEAKNVIELCRAVKSKEVKVFKKKEVLS
jgi:hypothetical protein